MQASRSCSDATFPVASACGLTFDYRQTPAESAEFRRQGILHPEFERLRICFLARSLQMAVWTEIFQRMKEWAAFSRSIPTNNCRKADNAPPITAIAHFFFQLDTTAEAPGEALVREMQANLRGGRSQLGPDESLHLRGKPISKLWNRFDASRRAAPYSPSTFRKSAITRVRITISDHLTRPRRWRMVER